MVWPLALEALQVVAFDAHRIVGLTAIVAQIRHWIKIVLVVTLETFAVVTFHAVCIEVKRIQKVAL